MQYLLRLILLTYAKNDHLNAEKKLKQTKTNRLKMPMLSKNAEL